jgi:cell division topological specificity factor
MFEFFKSLFKPAPPSGETAKERLRLVLLSDHLSLAPEVVESLKRDLMEVISRYVEIDSANADVTFEHREREIAMLASIPITGVRERKAPQAFAFAATAVAEPEAAEEPEPVAEPKSAAKAEPIVQAELAAEVPATPEAEPVVETALPAPAVQHDAQSELELKVTPVSQAPKTKSTAASNGSTGAANGAAPRRRRRKKYSAAAAAGAAKRAAQQPAGNQASAQA